MTDSIEIGSRIRAARKAAGYKTARSFIEKHDIPASTYSQHESGVRHTNDEILKLYSKFFSVNFDWLKTGKGAAFASNSKEYSNKTEILEQVLAARNKYLHQELLTIEKNELNEALLALLFEKMFEFSKEINFSLSSSELAHISSCIYSDLCEEDAELDVLAKMVKAAINVYKRKY